MSDPTLHELIAEHVQPDPTDTAREVLKALKVRGRIGELFLPLLRDECRRLARMAELTVERAESAATRGPQPSEHPPRLGSLDGQFYDGEKMIDKATATVADWERRIAFLTTFRDGLDRSIAWCREQIAKITAAGVTCLAEILQADAA